MSATNRGSSREEHDFYETPEWCVRRFLEKRNKSLDSALMLEPCAGDGAIIKAFNGFYNIPDDYSRNIWHANDINPIHMDELAVFAGISCEDALDLTYISSSILTNPPYKLAFPLAQHFVPQCEEVAFLLRLNWLASKSRNEWLKENPPDVYVLPDRPSFDGVGTDATDYGWFVWNGESEGRIVMLDVTPAPIRKAQIDAAYEKNMARRREYEARFF